MNLEKQKLLLSLMLSSSTILTKCMSIIQPKYFDPELQNTVGFIVDYYYEYSNAPSFEQVQAESSIKLIEQDISEDKIAYSLDNIEQFCKQKAIENAIIESLPMLEQNNREGMVDLITTAANVSLHRDMGLDYFDGVNDRMQRALTMVGKVKTGYKQLDFTLNGGFLRHGIHIFSANSGGGKSLVMGNIALNQIEMGYNVMYITLELSQDFVAGRFDMMITGVTEPEIKYKSQTIVDALRAKKDKCGHFHLKYLPSGSKPNDIKNYVNEYMQASGVKFDCIFVDYLDLIEPNKPVKMGDTFNKDKQASEELRNLSVELDACFVTASQQNREAVGETKITHKHIAGGISKINTCDVAISIIFNDAMKAEGIMNMQYLKTRYSGGEGQQEFFLFNNQTLRVTEHDNPEDRPIADKIQEINTEKQKKSSYSKLLDKFDI